MGHATLYSDNEDVIKSTKYVPRADKRKTDEEANGTSSALPSEAATRTGTQTPDEEEETPQISLPVAIGLLVVVTVFVAITAEWLVDSIDGLTENSPITREFVGVILLPIVGNAAEHVTAVTVSVKDKLSLSLGVAVGSSIVSVVLNFAYTFAEFTLRSKLHYSSFRTSYSYVFMAEYFDRFNRNTRTYARPAVTEATPHRFIVTLGWIIGKPLTLLFDPYQSVVLFLSVLLWVQRRKKHHPPGPPGYPFVGNALDMPLKKPWLKYVEWGKKYGDLIHLTALGQHILVLNSQTAVLELLERRSTIYSDRPRLVMAGELMGYNDCVPLLTHGDRHRESRKLLAEYLSPRKIAQSSAALEEKIRRFLLLLLESPDKFSQHTRGLVASSVFHVSHGYTVAPENDPILELAERADHQFAEVALPGAAICDLFPILRYIPEWTGAPFKTKAKTYRKTRDDLLEVPWDMVKKQMASVDGAAIPSFTASLIERNPAPGSYEEEVYKWASVAFYSAGADTTVSALNAFFLQMARHPDKLKKAQEEVDRVVGGGRLPTMADLAQLRYINAIAKEVLRIDPVAPLAIVHRLTKDDEYRGYHLSAGTLVVPNTWAILHDPELFPSPEEFMPERYLDTQESSSINPDPAKFAFGYGRRVCPGEALASTTLLLVMAMVIATFDISPIPGKEDELKHVDFTSALISHPNPFKCRIAPRSTHSAELIKGSV
ncbi:hypothetical protein VNI00_007960 [Paramarasmius palmivorus]|uniref:Sodium/calcium exchanger membrane region domain-containing protein n=1 Tax=Paramarasmius palmivorus TaxID=297713 RepID=A0AAW0CYC0_9AGAR